jgi:hypothetical protein
VELGFEVHPEFMTLLAKHRGNAKTKTAAGPNKKTRVKDKK